MPRRTHGESDVGNAANVLPDGRKRGRGPKAVVPLTQLQVESQTAAPRPLSVVDEHDSHLLDPREQPGHAQDGDEELTEHQRCHEHTVAPTVHGDTAVKMLVSRHSEFIA